ncbi:E3 ubiquitin-protein ligase MARCH2 [Punica granatum]|uniref:RING-CH-type domain-containing protein n=2 Tax=Punica granatum TaxID=22663 RepID=A0A218VXM7_PUNGR|nr:E3 ubiquitin-protein ligase MARCH2 [Punica granatum]OWM65073.1 hypothetical protein CDL15_Pgr028791 [Punica granatum]PKI76551.1 hypothetical protein CRG98_003102 [Punica granatum]
MRGDGSRSGDAAVDDHCGDVADLEKQGGAPVSDRPGGIDRVPMAPPQPPSLPPMPSPPMPPLLPPLHLPTAPQLLPPVTIVVSTGEPLAPPEGTTKALESLEELAVVASPKKGYLSRNGSSHEQCRVCQQDKDEALIDLGCQCRGGLAKAHRSCIDTWFRSKGSNKCEICQQAATNVSPPEPLPTGNSWIWRVDPALRGSVITEERRTCFSPLWVAFSILIGGLLLDVLISVTLGVSALPVNIIIGVIVVLGLGTALRLTLEFCHEWSLRRVVQRVETNVNLGYHPAL